MVAPQSRVVCYVERESFACANLVEAIKAGFMDEAPICSAISRRLLR